MSTFNPFPLTMAIVCIASVSAHGAGKVLETSLPDPGATISGEEVFREESGPRDPDLCPGWPVSLGTPGAGFPYTPTLYDVTGDGRAEVFMTGGHTFGLTGDGGFLPGWPTTEHAHMGYGTNGQMPGPSVADLTGDGTVAVLWSQRD